MNRRRFLARTAAATVAAALTAGAAHARRRGDRGTRGTRRPRESRRTMRVTVLGVWAIGIILLLEDTGEECEVVAHDGQGNSICELLH
jgi:hypothetical protein